MQTPYEILNVPIDANDTTIKQAYLYKVKENPPDRDQAQFQVIHDAYTAIKDHRSRISYNLFALPVADFEQLIDQALHTKHPLVLSPDYINQLFVAGIDEASLLNAISSPEK